MGQERRQFFSSNFLTFKKHLSIIMHFLIHHTFKLDQNVDEFWAVRDGVISAIDNEKDSNFESLSCLPIGRNGPVFCMWEGKEGMTAEHMQTYIDIRFGKVGFLSNVSIVMLF